MQVRPDKIRAFNREVWANCPAALAAVSAAPLSTACAGREAGIKNRCIKPEDLPHSLFCISEGTRKGKNACCIAHMCKIAAHLFLPQSFARLLCNVKFAFLFFIPIIARLVPTVRMRAFFCAVKIYNLNKC